MNMIDDELLAGADDVSEEEELDEDLEDDDLADFKDEELEEDETL